MRILPDARDLINLTERNVPVTPAQFGAHLRDHGHEVVLSFTNIRELAGPLAAHGDFLRVRTMLQALEAMPHTYLKEVGIIGQEIQAAVQAFTDGAEFQPISPYVVRWDRTLINLPGQANAPYERLIGLRLDEIVYDVFRFQPQVFAPPHHHLPQFVGQLERDRAALRSGRAPARQHFVNALRRHASTHRVALPPGREEELGRWIYANPARCPGMRLHHETYRHLMRNYGDVPEVGDFSDLAHVFAVPYVGVATLDNRMRDYCSRASVNLLRLGLPTDYRQRLRDNLQSFMDQP